MSPRPYTLGQREITAEQTRSRIVSAAHDVLSTADGPAAFSMDLVARRASVARMTVYHQFESKAHLLEAVFDFVASRGQLAGLPAALAQREPLEALAGFIAIFRPVWARGPRRRPSAIAWRRSPGSSPSSAASGRQTGW